ncbi:MAG: Fic family protein [Microbacteriaceae bacterium]|nr:MAG: Fic family protein [Microbacteriaceae bacterium]
MSSPWPPVDYETQTWISAAAASGDKSASLEQLTAHYDAAIPPYIARLTPETSTHVAGLASDALLELSRFDAELGERVAAFAPVLLRSEAAASSQIENLTASACQILTAELGARASSHALQITANTRAMRVALSLADELSPATIREMHKMLLEGQPRFSPGEFRKEAVWIGSRNDSPVGATFVPPVWTRVPQLVDDVVAFAGRRDVSPLVSVAVAHAQFETIHPFSDGNGRTGRALAQSMLRRSGVTRTVAVPVSAGLLADVDGYHQALMDYREGHVDPIVRAFALAALRAVANARQLISDIDAIRTSWNTRLTARRQSGAWRLLDVIARRPVLDAKTAAAELDVQVPNVYPPLRKLVEDGILQSKNEHHFGRVWRSTELLDAIDAFAERAGRRQLAS